MWYWIKKMTETQIWFAPTTGNKSWDSAKVAARWCTTIEAEENRRLKGHRVFFDISRCVPGIADHWRNFGIFYDSEQGGSSESPQHRTADVVFRRKARTFSTSRRNLIFPSERFPMTFRAISDRNLRHTPTGRFRKTKKILSKTPSDPSTFSRHFPFSRLHLSRTGYDLSDAGSLHLYQIYWIIKTEIHSELDQMTTGEKILISLSV